MSTGILVRGWIATIVAWGLVIQLAGCDSPSRARKTPPNPYPVLDSEMALIKTLEMAYHRRDFDKFVSLLASQDSVGYRFLPGEQNSGEFSWGAAEETRIHRRMFQPQVPVPGESPVRPELWLQAVDITLTPRSEFVKRPDLYRSVSNPDGLDPARWRATEATYGTFVLFQLAGSTDYQVEARAAFVVIEEEAKLHVNDPGKWLLYR
jgi:hypothetical protein